MHGGFQPWQNQQLPVQATLQAGFPAWDHASPTHSRPCCCCWLIVTFITLPTANERTFLSWCSMATTMGGVSSAMVGLSMSAAGSSEGRLISRKTVDLVSAVYVPVAIIMILYALFTYEWRSRFMHKKQVRRKRGERTWGCSRGAGREQGTL